MSERGVFAVDRGIWTDPDFAAEPFSEREAFMWLVSEAAFKDGNRRASNGRPMAMKRGEVSHSVRFMAEAWRWSKSRVDRFLKVLKNRDTLRDTSRDSAQVYSIKNYNKFQVIGLPKRDKDGTPDGTTVGQERDRLETRKQGNKESTGANAPAARAKGPTPLPADWQPDEALIAYAAAQGLTRSQALQRGEDMRVWAFGKGIKRASWAATFQGFCRPKGNGHERPATGPPRNGRARDYGDIIEAAESYLRQHEGDPDDRPPIHDLDLAAVH